MALVGALSACVAPSCQIDHRSLIQEPLDEEGGSDDTLNPNLPDAAGAGGARAGSAGANHVNSAGAGHALGGGSAETDGGEGGEAGSDANAGKSGHGAGGVTSHAGAGGSSGASGSAGKSGSGGTSSSGGTSASGGGSGGRPASGGTANVAGGAPPAPAPCPDLDGNGVSDCSETLLKNPGFDTSFVAAPSDWRVMSGATAIWDSLDSMSSHSGSALVTSTSPTDALGLDQCVLVQTGKSYEAYALMLIQAGAFAGFARLSEIFYASTDCSGNLDRVVASALEGTINGWRPLHVPPAPAESSGSLRVRLEVLKSSNVPTCSVHFDSALLIAK